MRVLYFVGSLGAGGIERFVTRIATKAKNEGIFEPVVCCLYHREGIFLPMLENGGIDVYGAPLGWMRAPGSLGELSSLVQQIAPDIVHSQVNFSMGQQLLAVRLAGKAAFCVTERNQYTLTGWKLLRRIVQFHCLRILGAHYSANSLAVAQHLADQVRTSVSSLPVLPNGVSLIPNNQPIRSLVRASLNWKEGDIGIGYVARMAPHKGHRAFLQALKNLLSLRLPVKAVLVGDGPQRDQLQEFIRELHIEDIVYLVGVVSNVDDYLQACDIVALFSEHEGMPNAILEAMAAGKAIVATGVGAIPELLDEGRAGCIVNGPSLETLTSALSALVEDENLRRELGLSAAARIDELFSLEISFAKLLQYYQQVIKGS